METELKFQVPAAQAEALRRAVATRSARSQRLQAVYAETPGRALAAAGLALRLRKEGRVWVQTLKGRGDGLLQRLEHEVRLPAQAAPPAFDPGRHDGTAPGARLAAVLAAASPAVLQPLYRTDIRRLSRRVRHAGALIEIAYDRGHVVAGEQRLPVLEIEFELVTGEPAALAALALRWVERFDLWWDCRTKSEIGLRLAAGIARVPAVKAQAPAWAAGARPAVVWQAALQAALAQVLPNAAEIAAGRAGPEHLHQLRVGLRRLRSVLRLLADWGDAAGAAAALEAAWREPFGRLGQARDADVQTQALRPQLTAAGAPAFDWPVPAATVDPGVVVRGRDFNRLLLRTLALVLAPAPADTQNLEPAAAAVLRQAWRQVRKDAAAYATAPQERQHRARKRLKRLRYVLEMLLPAFRRKPARALLRQIAAALDAMGELNDLQAAELVCRAIAAGQPQAWFAVGWLAARQQPVQQQAVAALARLQHAPRIWRRD